MWDDIHFDSDFIFFSQTTMVSMFHRRLLIKHVLDNPKTMLITRICVQFWSAFIHFKFIKTMNRDPLMDSNLLPFNF